MPAEAWLRRWLGAALTLLGAVATIWLALVGKLGFYIHPRYTAFTVTMAALGAGLVVAAVVTAALRPTSPDQHHDDHDHDAADPGPDASPRRARLISGLRAALLVTAALVLLVIPPSTLTERARLDRDLATSDQGLGANETTVLAGGDPATFSVKDWASQLRTGGQAAVLGQHVELSGYVLDRGEDDVFFLVRMLITCCAVDAHPVGVPVSRPDWRRDFKPGQWVEVDGTFGENPDRDSRSATVIRPQRVTRIQEPAKPYVF